MREVKGANFPGIKCRERKKMDGEGQRVRVFFGRGEQAIAPEVESLCLQVNEETSVGMCMQNTAVKAMMSKTWHLFQGIYSFFVG